MKKFLLIALILALTIPAAAIDRHGLLGIGVKGFYWIPLGDFGNAYNGSFGGGARVSYGIGPQMEIFGEGWYGHATFDEDYWTEYQDYDPQDDPNEYYLTTFQFGARYTLMPYSEFDPYLQAAAGYYTWHFYRETETGGEWGSASESKFGINLRAGGEYFIKPNMSLDFGVDWISIFDVEVAKLVMDHDSGTFRYVEATETVNIVAPGIGLNLYF